MTYRELCIQFIEKHKSIATIIISREAGEELTNIYYLLTGKVVACSGCANEALMAYNSIVNYINRDSNPEHPFNKGKIMSNYKFKKDVLAYCNTLHRHFNASTLTDEAAIALIAENENNLGFFEQYPADYLKDVDAYLAAKSDEKELAEQSQLLQEEVKEEQEQEEAKEPAPAKKSNNNHKPSGKK